MCDPNVTLEMVTDPSGKFRRISVEDVIVGDLVYMVWPEHPNYRPMCAKILEKTHSVLTYTYPEIKHRDSLSTHLLRTPFIRFINGEIELYMELDYREPREALLRLEAGTQLSDDHIQRFLFDDMMMREYLSYIDADGFKRHRGGKKHNKKTRKSRKSRKSKTFKNIK